MISSESFFFPLIYLYTESITLLPMYYWVVYITAYVLLYYNDIATLILLGAYITAYVIYYIIAHVLLGCLHHCLRVVLYAVCFILLGIFFMLSAISMSW